MFWFRRMLQDEVFTAELKCRWTELRESFLTDEYFINAIDSMASFLEEPQKRNYERWKILGNYVWPNQYIGQTYQDEINFMKQWILTRLSWMDLNMPGTCTITAINEEQLKGLEIYPNPSNGMFYVKSAESITPGLVNVTIINMMGQRIYYSTSIEENILWNGLTNDKQAAPGIYIAEIKTKRGVRRQRIVKE
jgi:hypothetical protein